jgi:ABC-type uncharacterized transport system substrate-binding protein
VRDKNIHAYYAIASLALQSLMNRETNRPIVYSAVTSPEDLGITQKSHKNVLGVSDLINIKKQLSVIQNLMRK